MDVTDIPENVRDTDAEPPDFTAWDAPGEVLTGGSTRERMLDVIVQLHDPANVSTIATRAECDTETARDYLEWFESNDFSVHYPEQYANRARECRWDTRPNEHNTRGHFHLPPDAATPGEDAEFAADRRDVLTRLLRELDERVQALWN